MPLQNRVDPFGSLIKTTARGAWMGNRGQLHNDQQQILRPYRLKAWITCLLHFNNRKRQVMAPHRYTELFFLDEATAFSAGHRPCFECRRKAYQEFKTRWLQGNPEYGFTEKTSIQQIDDILQRERIGEKNEKITWEASPQELPEGTFVLYHNQPHCIARNMLFPWTPEGYGKPVLPPTTSTITVLTPASIVNTFRAGYIPQIAIPLI